MKVKYVGPHDAVNLALVDGGGVIHAEHGKYVEVPAAVWPGLVQRGDFERAPVKPSKPKGKPASKPAEKVKE